MSAQGMPNQYSNVGYSGSPSWQGYRQGCGGHDHYQYGQNQGGPTSSQQGNAGPPQPPYNPPLDRPPLPQGWVPLFDHWYGHWYYVEEATGRTQWEAPGSSAPTPMQGAPAPDRDGYGAPPGPPSGGAYAGYEQAGTKGQGGEKGDEKKSSGAGGMLLGAAGGMAAGAVLHHAMSRRRRRSSSSSSSSDGGKHEHSSYAAAATATPYAFQNEYPSSYYPAPAAYARGDESDGESLNEARANMYDARAKYQEALEKAASSSASSSDREELEEAREELYGAEEEYAEEYNDFYDDD